MNFNTRTLARLATGALAAAALAACASHPPPPPGAPIGPPSAENGPPGGYDHNGPPPGPNGPIPGSTQDFVVNVGDRVYFDFDHADIRADAAPVLTGQSDWLRRYPMVRVRIEGNCDERGTREYNFALGARRADSVRDFLVSHGVAAGRITTISYGKEQPVDGGHDDAAWAHNRNAHTAITEGAR
ncbi:MAG TPA: peptidoglycan-associated lipoprotein Pal [Caulobacteraceae bacterium]|jgi:peptidoglycan-associated lipoprotein|nr:peptidoglycan-associated lipoprotein Pal [Caulobacteraceae bacterium]